MGPSATPVPGTESRRRPADAGRRRGPAREQPRKCRAHPYAPALGRRPPADQSRLRPPEPGPPRNPTPTPCPSSPTPPDQPDPCPRASQTSARPEPARAVPGSPSPLVPEEARPRRPAAITAEDQAPSRSQSRPLNPGTGAGGLPACPAGRAHRSEIAEPAHRRGGNRPPGCWPRPRSLVLVAGAVVSLIVTSHHTTLAAANRATPRPARRPRLPPRPRPAPRPGPHHRRPRRRAAPTSAAGAPGPAVIPAGYHEFRQLDRLLDRGA